MEIERKWLVRHEDLEGVMQYLNDTLPQVADIDCLQYFLSTEPYVRVQRQLDKVSGYSRNILCIKGDTALSRVEVEKLLTNEEFGQLVGVCGKEAIFKQVRAYMIGDDLKLELHVMSFFSKHLLSYIEVEFGSEKQASKFDISKYVPSPSLRDVTGIHEYYMNNVWNKIHG